MFHGLSPAFLCHGLAGFLRSVGRDEDRDGAADDEFTRTQLLTASSLARLLALELEHGREVEAWLADALHAELAWSQGDLDAGSVAAAERLRSILAGGWGADAEDALSDLLRRLERSQAGGAAGVLARLRSRIREGVDHEVAMFAEGMPPR